MWLIGETFKNYGQSINAHIVKQPENSALYEPFTRIPNTFTAAQKGGNRIDCRRLSVVFDAGRPLPHPDYSGGGSVRRADLYLVAP